MPPFISCGIGGMARLDRTARSGYLTASPADRPRVTSLGRPMAAVHADLRLWSEPAAPQADEAQLTSEGLFVREAFRAPPREFDAEPYSLGWFEQIERQRYARHGYWLPKLLEFNRHGGETLLGLGDGLGTDWLQHRRHGAEVIVCHPLQEQLGLMKRNFDLRNESGRFLHAP